MPRTALLRTVASNVFSFGFLAILAERRVGHHARHASLQGEAGCADPKSVGTDFGQLSRAVARAT